MPIEKLIDHDRYRPRRRGWHVQRNGRMLAFAILLLIIFRLCIWPLLTFSELLSASGIEHYDLDDYKGFSIDPEIDGRVLICIPLRNAAPVIPLMWSHLQNLTYPAHLIDVAFLVSDTDDSTLQDLRAEIRSNSAHEFNSISVFEKNFGQIIGQGFSDRHGVAVQAIRRKLMGRARNWLLSAALKPYHSWVYWRDADIERSPPTIIEDLMQHGRDVIVPNVWRPLPDWLGHEQPYDLNSWQESEPALELAKQLHEDDVIVEGYAEYPTWRPHMAYFRDANGDMNEVMDLDGIGGVSILCRAHVFRKGANFPGFALWNHAETEAFGKMCRKMGFSVGGLVHYTIWHMYEPSEDDLKKMKEMEEEAKQKAKPGQESDRADESAQRVKEQQILQQNSLKKVTTEKPNEPVVQAFLDK